MSSSLYVAIYFELCVQWIEIDADIENRFYLLFSGTAYTFISLKEEQYAPVMVKVIEKAGQTPVPPELLEMSKQFKSKVAKGVRDSFLSYLTRVLLSLKLLFPSLGRPNMT